MKKSLLAFLALFALHFCYAQKDVTVPDVTSFDTGVGSQSSVNSSNGKLNLALNLISLKGYKDLGASFGIAYDGAQVPKQVKASNEMIPTGILGLGWGMQIPRILVDNKLTAARDDDRFYMFEGGGLNELIAISKTSSEIEFQTKMVKPWKVKYFPNEEKWEVIKDNGYKYTYDYVDWVLYWENWIGNSNAPNAQRQGSGWSLSSIEDIYGNKISYDYFSQMQNLPGSSSSTKRHTEATYLEYITGASGEKIKLIYNDKSSNEYHEGNTNSAEPDAYQEIYEKKFLKAIEAYDANDQLLYSYDLSYDFVGSGEYRKRLLKEITLIGENGEEQLFREFQYNTDANSDYFGLLEHQILPTKGRVSYQYTTKEVEVDQVFEISGNSKSSFIIQKDYMLKLTYLEDLNKYLYVSRLIWDGNTWQEEHLDILPGIMKIEDQENGGYYLDAQVIARENFFAILYRVNGANFYRKSYGLKDDGVTWEEFSGIFHVPGATNSDAVRLIGGEDFYAIGNPRQDRLNFYRWDGYSWKQDYFYNNTPGHYYYTASNNYVIQHNKDTGPDTVKFYYYDITNTLQNRIFNTGLETSGSGNYASYWYGAHSFALVNANANPEFYVRWDKDYNYIAKDVAPFGSVPDDITSEGFYNSVFATTNKRFDFFDGDWQNETYVTRYKGNGNWALSSTLASQFIYDKSLSGFGDDFYVHPKDVQHPDIWNPPTSTNVFHVFNANTGSWHTSEFSTAGNTNYKKDKLSFDVFGSKYALANAELYKLNTDFTITSLSTYPVNTIFSKSDGGNTLYISSRNGSSSSGGGFAKVLSLTDENQIVEFDMPNDMYLHTSKYKSFPSHALGYNTLVLSNSGNTSFKIYRLIDGKLDYNAQGKTIQKDIVVVKETFDPVISRKHRKYFCYFNPKAAKDNQRVFYSIVSQQNDANRVLGSSATFYDAGLSDIRRQGLPLKTQSFDADDQLLSEQVNHWDVKRIGLEGRYYINLRRKETRSLENDEEFKTDEFYSYHQDNGLIRLHEVLDSEGNTEYTETTYLYEHYPEVLDDNLISPVIYTRNYSQFENDPIINKYATAVKWDLSGIPRPQSNYAWDGTGSTNFDFSSTPSNFRDSQAISQVDAYGNVLEETNRSQVVTSYIYGYGNKRLVAKVEGATYAQAIAQVNLSTLNNPSSETQLLAELQNLRDGLPNAYVTSYAYHVGVGLTTMVDSRGRHLTYEYDNFFRLSHIVDHEGHIVKKNEYQYRQQPFTYESEPMDVLDCPTLTVPSDPLTLTLTKVSGSDTASFYEVTASDGGNYTYEWVYAANSGNVNNFPYIATGNHLSSTNPNCNDGELSIFAKIVDASGQTIVQSNIVNHTYSSGPECNPQ